MQDAYDTTMETCKICVVVMKNRMPRLEMLLMRKGCSKSIYVYVYMYVYYEVSLRPVYYVQLQSPV